MLTAKAVTHSYSGRAVLAGVDLQIGAGEVVGLGGMSGAGKSTLGCILAGQICPDGGEVLLEGRPLEPPRKTAGAGQALQVQYAPQSPELAVDPRWTIRKVLENGGPVDPDVVEALGIREVWYGRRPSQLSGGELARVSLARLFHPQLRVLICDEITSQLDALAQDRLLRALVDVARSRGIGIMLISHSPALHERFCDRSLHLSQGRLS